MKTVIRRAASDDRGATAVEYALLAAVLMVTLVAILPDFILGVDGLYRPIIEFFAPYAENSTE